jgi:hypothetical protein
MRRREWVCRLSMRKQSNRDPHPPSKCWKDAGVPRSLPAFRASGLRHDIRDLLLDRSENKKTNRAICYMEPRTVIRRTQVLGHAVFAITALGVLPWRATRKPFLRTPMSSGKRNQSSDNPPSSPTRILQTDEAGADI